MSRWLVQFAVTIAVAAGLSATFSDRNPSAQQPAASAAGSPCAVNNGGCAAGVTCQEGPTPGAWRCGDACPPGFGGSPQTGCVDVNECAVGNGGCHVLAKCRNTPGSRTCSACPSNHDGNGYVGCFDVNDCPKGDCSGKLPKDAETAAPPVVSTSGDVTIAANSSAGATATFSASATDTVDGARRAACVPASGTSFPIGKTTVTCWATNTRGKIGRATLTVTVTAAQF